MALLLLRGFLECFIIRIALILVQRTKEKLNFVLTKFESQDQKKEIKRNIKSISYEIIFLISGKLIVLANMVRPSPNITDAQ